MGRYSDQPFRLWIGVVLLSLLIAFLNVLLYGDVGTTLALIFVVLFFVVSLFRPTLSLYAFVFIALCVEQLVTPFSWTEILPYHLNLGGTYAFLRGVSLNPLEVHLLVIITGVLLRFLIRRDKFVQPLAPKQLLIYAGSIAFFILYGLFRGGTFLPALWETRGIIYLTLLVVIIPQIVRTIEQVKHMVWALIAGMTFRIVEVLSHYAAAGFTFLGSDGGWGNHEDAGFFAVMLVFTVALYALKVGRNKEKGVLAVLAIPTLVAIVASDRRTAYPVFAAGLVLLILLLPKDFQRKVMRYAWKFAIVFVIYMGAFWNTTSNNPLFVPVRSIKEGIAGDDQAAAGESYSSNLYRKVENYDLSRMVVSQPILGYGYGIPIDYFLPIPVTWELGLFVPHNQILAVYVKTGVVGFTIFMFFYLSVMREVTHGFRLVGDDAYLKAVLALVGAAIVNHLVYSFFDIMLTYYRCNVFLGTLLGITGTILAVKHEEKKQESPLPQKTASPTYANTPARWLLDKHNEESTPVGN